MAHALARLDFRLIDLVGGRAAIHEVGLRLGFASAQASSQNQAQSSPDVTTDKVTARLGLRFVLAAHVGVEAARRAFVTEADGKPTLAPHPGMTPVAFNLAHIEGLALVAISSGGMIGADIEQVRPVRLTPVRRALLVDAGAGLSAAPLPDGPEDVRFVQAWTRLEALAKATGEGMGSLLGRIRDGQSAERMAGGRQKPLEPVSRDGGGLAVFDLDLMELGSSVRAAVAVPVGDGAGLTPGMLRPSWLPRDAASLAAVVGHA